MKKENLQLNNLEIENKKNVPKGRPVLLLMELGGLCTGHISSHIVLLIMAQLLTLLEVP